MSQQIAPPVPSSTVDEPLIYRAIDVQRHGTSYILQFLNDGDLLACAKTSRYFRHLAFSLYFRDLTFHIHPPLDEASTNGKGSLMIDDEAEEELAESRDGDDGEESSGSDTDESEESGVEDDGIPDAKRTKKVAAKIASLTTVDPPVMKTTNKSSMPSPARVSQQQGSRERDSQAQPWVLYPRSRM